jgi:DNA replication and repair protein RecF
MNNQLLITEIQLKNFRCFDKFSITFDNKIVLVYGVNGTGKTSLIEGIYYGCYLRSFRTYLTRELLALGKESFFIKIFVKNKLSDTTIDHTIQIGFSNNKKLVKVDEKPIISYKELLSYYRVVSLTEDDLQLIQGSPEERRSFLNQALLLIDPSLMALMREYKIILDNRNALLQNNTFHNETYWVWTKKLWESTGKIQEIRRDFLGSLEYTMNAILHDHIEQDITAIFNYQPKKEQNSSFEDFWTKNYHLFEQEKVLKRSLFGAHVDDFFVLLEGKKSRNYASRGEQKMIVLLIKIAQIRQLNALYGPIIFLLDDFMTDFDNERGKSLLKALFELDCQLIFTSPRRDNNLENSLQSQQISYSIVSI